jgi:hypothetical protein
MPNKLHIAIIASMAVVISVSSCDRESDRGLQELKRDVSPDGLWEAVLARDLIGGATVGSMYYVFVIPTGSTLDDAGREILRLRD